MVNVNKFCEIMFASLLFVACAQFVQAQELIFKLDQEAATNRGLRVDSAAVERVATQAQARLDQMHDEEEIEYRIDVETDSDQNQILLKVPTTASSEDVAKIKSGLLKTTFIEFALLANSIHHAELIKLSQQPNQLNKTHLDNGEQLVGLWCPVAMDAKGNPKITANQKFATRPTIGENETAREFLVVIPPRHELRLTNSDFIKVEKQKSDFGPMIGFEFNNHGASLMEELTSNNLPTIDRPAKLPPETPGGGPAAVEDNHVGNVNLRARLAIIINDKIHMAPSINSVISSKGVIQGNFTENEVDELIQSLRLLPLEIPLILVEEHLQDQD